MAPFYLEIAKQLELIITHPDFKATRQQINLLKYIVKQTLAGRANQITSFSIATNVFGRKHEDYDQACDPIVNIQAGRLRRSLARYYQTAGKKAPIFIRLPEGIYAPVFKKRRRNSESHLR